MDIKFTVEEEQFRTEVVSWLEDNLCGEFETLRFRGGPGDEHMFFTERCAWEKKMAAGRWIGLAWPERHGGRGFDVAKQVVFYEEYARAGGPGRVGHIGETLAGPTIIAFGDTTQQEKFLPGILSGEELWCQCYSEPNAGSDLANVRTKARLDSKSKQWVIEGQKTWTSLATQADWGFVLARCEEGSVGRHGLCYLLVPMHQDNIEVRPIRQITGTSEFNEVFFDGARTDASHIVGEPGQGWKVAMGTLNFERGVSTIGQQLHFYHELKEVVNIAIKNGKKRDPIVRQRLAQAWAQLAIMRYNTLRVLSDSNTASLPPEAMISKLYWSNYHRDFGKLAMDVIGPASELLEGENYALSRLQSIYLYSRADTIYAGTNEIQRDIIARRALGLPRSAPVTKNAT